jgi:hypothetical protein
VVLDIAFASNAGGQSFESVTQRFIDALGPRLVAWIDHHDSAHHALYQADARFVLRTKAEHPACPELVTPERVKAAGSVDTIVCHGDFDGLASAAKWLRGGHECYPGCDQDARAIDTRIGLPSNNAARMDRAIRGAPKDTGLLHAIVQHLSEGAQNQATWAMIERAGHALAALEAQAAIMSAEFLPIGAHAVWLDTPERRPAFDKTALLLAGQQLAKIALVADGDTLTLAAAFDSGIDFLRMFELSGGMPTVVSLKRERLAEVLARLQALSM